MIRTLTIAVATLGAAGCYSPEYDPCAIACTPDLGCPSGLTCVANTCVPPGGPSCAADVELEPPRTNMVRVLESAFTMGCLTAPCNADDPPHEVWVSTFDVDILEATQAEYEQCINTGPCVTPQQVTGEVQTLWDPENLPDTPVHGLSWSMADAYCRWQDKRLLTEAEWEKAARGSDDRPFPWGEAAPDCDHANFAGCGLLQLDPVGSHPDGVSAHGAHDMAGNVFEWVSDRYEVDYYNDSAYEDPRGPETGTLRVIRGGGYKTGEALLNLRASQRFGRDPVTAATTYGVRCGQAPIPSSP